MLKPILATAAVALLCGFFAWPIPLHDYIWYGDLPGVMTFFVLAVFSYVALRPIPRAKIALLFSALALMGSAGRQSYEREKIQNYCESEEISDCGSQLSGLPAFGWPVILSPFLSALFLRKFAAVPGKMGSKIKAFAAVGMIAILGWFAWPWPVGGIALRDGDLPGAVVAFPTLFLSILALRAGPSAFMAVVLSISAFAGVSERHTFEVARILVECRHCAAGVLPRAAEYGWPVVSVPLLAFAFTKMSRRSFTLSE